MIPGSSGLKSLHPVAGSARGVGCDTAEWVVTWRFMRSDRRRPGGNACGGRPRRRCTDQPQFDEHGSPRRPEPQSVQHSPRTLIRQLRVMLRASPGQPDMLAGLLLVCPQSEPMSHSYEEIRAVVLDVLAGRETNLPCQVDRSPIRALPLRSRVLAEASRWLSALVIDPSAG